MLDEVNEIIMSNLTRSSIKAKAATATASKAIKTVWKHVYPKQKKYPDEAKFTKYCICWFDMSDWCFMLLPSCSSDHACSLPKDEGACFIVLLRQWRENLPYVLYTEAAEETATVLILESIVRHYVSVRKSRFAIFNQYNVNNVKLNSWYFHSTQVKMYNGV